jgi:hydrogenase maturation factor
MRVILPTETHLKEHVSDIRGWSNYRCILREFRAPQIWGGFDEVDDEVAVKIYAPGHSRLW